MPRASAASSQQPFGTQNGRRRTRAEVEDEDEDEEVNVTDEDEAEQTQRTGGMSEEDLRKQAAKLIRFALGTEHNKKAFQRAQTNKIIPQSRQFPTVLARAQEVLKKTMGMELVEVRPKFKIGDDLEEATQATQAAQTRATQSKKKGKGKERSREDDDEDEEEEEEEGGGQSQVARVAAKKPKPKSNLYVLRSILPIALLEQMSDPTPIELAPVAANEGPREVNGSLIDWESGDGTASAHPALLGIRTVILSLVLINSRAMSDDQLHGFLKRLSLERDTPLPYKTPTASGVTPLTLDKYLDVLDKQLYLQKVKIATPGKAESHAIEWRWGQRQAEFSEKAAAKFIEDIMFFERDEDEEPVAGRKRGAAGPPSAVASVKEQRKKMRIELERAVGSELQGDL